MSRKMCPRLVFRYFGKRHKLTSTGNKIFLYLSDIDLESSYSYVTTSRHQAVNIGMFSLNGLRTPDPLMYEYVKKWIKTQSRFSTLISGSGELRRIHYFKRQREIVAQLG